METRNIPLCSLHPNTGQIDGVPKNPRFIRDEKFAKLRKSIEDDPEMLELRELGVYESRPGYYVVLLGNMRLRAMKDLGYKDAPCKIIPQGTDAKKLRAYTVKDNVSYGDNDWDIMANEWDASELMDWGMDLPTEWEDGSGIDTEDHQAGESEEEEIERKKQDFEERIKAGELSEEDEEYQAFVEKFKLKKTTDDCYTPELVYDAVADWVSRRYGIGKGRFVRPFYPGGDYQSYFYPNECVVVDNPPFSIMAEILKFYHSHCIKFFLFGPHLTLFSSSSSSAIVTGVSITYDNGANVNTSFLTNLEPASVRFKSEPSLYAAIKAANDENLKSMRKSLPKYSYDHHLVTTPFLSALSRLGIDFSVSVSESCPVDQLDSQKASGKAIFGKGYLISEEKYIEREKAEREKAERWELSERERKIISMLGRTAEKLTGE